jgi:anti-sigma factor RsiW
MRWLFESVVSDPGWGIRLSIVDGSEIRGDGAAFRGARNGIDSGPGGTGAIEARSVLENQIQLVHAYLDGELDPANTIAVGQEIERNPRLARELASASALQRALREHFPLQPVPPALRARIDAAIGRSSRRLRPSWATLAASVLVAMTLSSVSTFLLLRAPAGDAVLTEVVDSHMRSLIAAAPLDVTSSERHVVKPWFNGRIPQAPRVIDLKADEFPLIGARIDVIARTPVPTLVYKRRLHTISLVALPASRPIQTSSGRSENGFNVVHWIDGETSYVATSDLNAAELNTFAKLFRAAP